MEVVTKKIMLSEINGGKIYFKINLSQTIDNLGLLTDIPYSENKGYSLTQYIKDSGQIIIGTDSKLNLVKSYSATEPYKVNLDIKRETYNNYKAIQINGVDRVISVNEDEIKYTLDAKKDVTLGTSGQTTGILYIDNPIDGIELPNELSSSTTITKGQYMGEGWNETNISIDPQIQEEYLIGIISTPEVRSDVFIDRGTNSVLDKHLRLSEIKNLDHLVKYGNGFYKINRN